MTKVHPTHRGLAIRCVDVAAGRLPGINKHPLQGLHPDSEKPIGYDDAIDAATGLNYMDTPAAAVLIGASPQYVAAVRLFAPGTTLSESEKGMGYRVGESYWMPADAAVLPYVWEAREAEGIGNFDLANHPVTKNRFEVKTADLPHEPIGNGQKEPAEPRRPLMLGDQVCYTLNPAGDTVFDGVVYELRMVQGKYNKGPTQQCRLYGEDVWRWDGDLYLILPSTEGAGHD